MNFEDRPIINNYLEAEHDIQIYTNHALVATTPNIRDSDSSIIADLSVHVY